MKLGTLLIIGILLALLPVAVTGGGWNLVPFSSLMDELEEDFFFRSAPFLRGRRSYPPHEVADTVDTFQVTLDLEGVPNENIHVSIENNNDYNIQNGGLMMLVIHGHREVEEENYKYQGSFSQRFGLNPSVQVDKIVATRKDDGKLIISAPKRIDYLEGPKKSWEIPIESRPAIGSGLSIDSRLTIQTGWCCGKTLR